MKKFQMFVQLTQYKNLKKLWFYNSIQRYLLVRQFDFDIAYFEYHKDCGCSFCIFIQIQGCCDNISMNSCGVKLRVHTES